MLKRKLEFEEYLHYDDGTDNKYELFEGALVVVPLPIWEHAALVLLLQDLLKPSCGPRGWKAYPGNVGVRIRPRRARIPDITVMSPPEQPGKEAVVEDPPTLVVEVVSRTTRKTDLGIKRSEYATVGIPEYWIVDMDEGEFRVLRLKDGVYEETVFRGDDRIESQTFGTLSVTPAALWKQALATKD